MAGMVTVVFTDKDFDQEVLQADLPVLVDFWGERCAPCKVVGPVIDSIADDYSGRARVGKLDIYENQRSAARFGISSIPTVILFHNGEIKEKFVGVRPEKDYKAALDNLIGQTAG